MSQSVLSDNEYTPVWLLHDLTLLLLRKDNNGRWKIYGWQPVEEEKTENE